MFKNSFNRYLSLLIILAVTISIASYLYYSSQQLVVSYNDARSHLNMSRLVLDNLKPGFAQMGSVWLPLNHLLMLPFVWNYTLWQSGFAGSISSMVAYVVGSIFIYLILHELTKKPRVAFIAALVFILNPNVIYMQVTPMTELTLLAFFIGASYYLIKWINTKYNVIYLILCSFMVFCATLTRYDGWFLYLSLLPTIAAITIMAKWDHTKKLLANCKKIIPLLEGRLVLFATIGGFGIFLWLLWNLLIYKDALYFMLGPFSAHAQQEKIKEAGSLLTYHNLPLSLEAYWTAMIDNIGSLLMFSSIIGLFYFVIKNKISPIAFAVYTLLSPLIFHLLSLFMGHSILVTPELGVEVTQQAKTSWFNVRYGLMIVPAIAVFSAYLVSRSKVLQVILVVIIIVQAGLLYARNDVVTLTDGAFGTSSLRVGDASDWLKKNVKSDELILTSIAFNNALAFSTGMQLKQFIHEGTGKYWSESLQAPSKHAKWIVMANGDVGDEIYNKMIKEKNQNFEKNYQLKERGEFTNIYELVAAAKVSKFIGRDGSKFIRDGKDFSFVGVNSYDLAYRSKPEIDLTMVSAKENGITVIRLWAFGEGVPDGFQPNQGIYSKEKLDKLAYIVSVAEKNNIHLIITFANYWKEYGGIDQDLMWNGQKGELTPKIKDSYFTNDASKDRYKKYVDTVVNYDNPYTKKKLKDDVSIMAWELMNEPRSSETQSAPQILTWLDAMSSHIKSLDTNHLVFSGVEGFTKEYNDGNNGPLLTDVAKLKNIDALTAHFYFGETKKDIPRIFKSWGEIKASTNKPLFVEEVGFEKNSKDKPRELLFDEVFNQIQSNNLNGILFWNWALQTDTSFGISPRDQQDALLLKQIKFYSESLK